MDQFSHDPFDGLAADDPARNRHQSRDSLFLMADFRIAGSPKIAALRVRNLSTGGLMAEYSGRLPQGMEVECDLRGIGWVPGKIAWCAAGRIGVAFYRLIDPILARKPVGVAPKAPYYTQPHPRR